MAALHGTLVAVMNSGPDGVRPMFLFGFVGVFLITCWSPALAMLIWAPLRLTRRSTETPDH